MRCVMSLYYTFHPNSNFPVVLKKDQNTPSRTRRW